MPSQPLPVELIDHITKDVLEQEDTTAIRALCLTSRTFVEPVQAIIFRHITLDEYHRPAAFLKLLRLPTSKKLIFFIKKLSFAHFALQQKAFIQVLSKVKCLEELVFPTHEATYGGGFGVPALYCTRKRKAWIDLNPDVAAALTNCVQFLPSLKSLVLRDLSKFPIDTILEQALPSLRHLDISNVELDGYLLNRLYSVESELQDFQSLRWTRELNRSIEATRFPFPFYSLRELHIIQPFTIDGSSNMMYSPIHLPQLTHLELLTLETTVYDYSYDLHSEDHSTLNYLLKFIVLTIQSISDSAPLREIRLILRARSPPWRSSLWLHELWSPLDAFLSSRGVLLTIVLRGQLCQDAESESATRGFADALSVLNSSGNLTVRHNPITFDDMDE